MTNFINTLYNQFGLVLLLIVGILVATLFFNLKTLMAFSFMLFLKIINVIIIFLLLACIFSLLILVFLSLKDGYEIYNKNSLNFIKEYLPFIFSWVDDLKWRGLNETLKIISIIKIILILFISGIIANLIISSLILNIQIELNENNNEN